MNFEHVVCHERHAVEAYVATCLVALVLVLNEVATLVLNAVAAGGEPAVAMLAFERLLAGMHPQVQLQI